MVTKTTIFVMVGVFLLIATITVFFVRFYPILRFGIFSPCWGTFTSDIGEITLMPWEKERTETVILGDCVKELVFLNKAGLEKFQGAVYDTETLGCGQGESFIIGIPKGGSDDVPFYRIDKKIWEALKSVWQDTLGGIKPKCVELDKPIVPTEGLDLKGPTQGSSIKYCITVSKNADSYSVTKVDGECPVK